MSFGEPWIASQAESGVTIHKSDGEEIVDDFTGNYAERIVACVNALAGLDPAAVARVVEAARKWRDELSTGDTIEALLDALAALGKEKQ